MRRNYVAASLVCLLFAAGACANIADLNEFSKGKCSGGGECDAGRGDSTVDSGDDASDEADAIEPTDGTVDSGSEDAGTDRRVEEAGRDAPEDTREDTKGDASEGGAECDATDTVQNCGACGAACDPVHATADSCGGASCIYTCVSGYFDCNAGSVPDLDGCECVGTGCCGTSCQAAHTDGVGQTFFDCNPLGTYRESEASEACKAYQAATGGTGGCGKFGCDVVDAGDAGLVGEPPYTVCALNDARDRCKSHCWGYTEGGLAGNVYDCLCTLDGGETKPQGTWE